MKSFFKTTQGFSVGNFPDNYSSLKHVHVKALLIKKRLDCDNLNNSVAFPRVLFELEIKKINQPSPGFPQLYRDFYRLLIVASIDHWLPKMLFIHLIYYT